MSIWDEAPVVDSEQNQTSSDSKSIWDEAPVVSKVNPNADYEAFRQQQINEAKQGPLSKIGGMIGQGAQAIGGFAKSAVSGATNTARGLGETLGEASAAPTMGQAIKQGAGNLVQSGIEAGTGLAYDAGNLIRSKLTEATDKIKRGDLSPLFPGLGLGMAVATNLLPHGLSEQQIQDAYQRKLADEAMQRKSGETLVPEVYGKANPTLVKGLEDLPNTIGVGGIGKGLLEAAAKTTIGGIAKGVGRTITNEIHPQAEGSLMSALSPGTRQAIVGSTEKSIKTILPDIGAMSEVSGIKWDTAKGAEDLSKFAKKAIWDKVEQAKGAPILLNASKAADAGLSIVMDNTPKAKAMAAQFPGAIDAIQREMAPFAGKVMSPAEMEEHIQILNAKNEAIEAKTPQQKAAILKSDPVAAARMEAVKSLRSQMDDALAGYNELKHQYGSWKVFGDLAQRQAIRQAKLEGNLSLYEGLGALKAVGDIMEKGPIKGLTSFAAGKALAHMRTPDYAFGRAFRTIERQYPNPVPPSAP